MDDVEALSSPLGSLVAKSFGIERVFRKRRDDVGGVRVVSKTVFGSATGVIPDLNTDTGKKEWTEIRGRRLESTMLVCGEAVLEPGTAE